MTDSPAPRAQAVLAEHTAREVLAMHTTSMLADMLRKVDIQAPASVETRMVRAWIIDALESRYPAASQAVEDAFSRADAALINAPADSDPNNYEIDYVAVLLAAIPQGDLR